MERKYVMTAFGYAIVGLLLGIYMASTKNHGQLVTHAHIMLVGFVVSFIYGVCYRLWPVAGESRLPTVQYGVHQAGTLVLVVALFLLYGRHASAETLGPVLGIGSVLVLIGMVIMKVVFIRASRVPKSGDEQLQSA